MRDAQSPSKTRLDITCRRDKKRGGGTIPPPRPTPSTTPTAPTTSNGNQSPTPTPNNPQQPVPLPTPPLEPQLLKVSFAQVERVSGNSILVVATAETTSGGWRVKAEHEVNRDTLDVWIKGTPPEGRATKALSHPTVTTTVADPSRAIRRVIVHGLGNDRALAIPQQIRR